MVMGAQGKCNWEIGEGRDTNCTNEMESDRRPPVEFSVPPTIARTATAQSLVARAR